VTDINRLFGAPEPDTTPASRADQLDYIADLIAELETLAARSAGSELLKGLLALAHDEARRLAKSTPSETDRD
jgi:hypothetical protein